MLASIENFNKLSWEIYLCLFQLQRLSKLLYTWQRFDDMGCSNSQLSTNVWKCPNAHKIKSSLYLVFKRYFFNLTVSGVSAILDNYYRSLNANLVVNNEYCCNDWRSNNFSKMTVLKARIFSAHCKVATHVGFEYASVIRNNIPISINGAAATVCSFGAADEQNRRRWPVCKRTIS